MWHENNVHVYCLWFLRSIQTLCKDAVSSHFLSWQNKRMCDEYVGTAIMSIWRLTQRKVCQTACYDSGLQEWLCYISSPPSKIRLTKVWTIRQRTSEDDCISVEGSNIQGYQWQAKTKPQNQAVYPVDGNAEGPWETSGSVALGTMIAFGRKSSSIPMVQRVSRTH